MITLPVWCCFISSASICPPAFHFSLWALSDQPLACGMALDRVPITVGSSSSGAGKSKHSSWVSRFLKNAGTLQRPFEMCFHSTCSIQNSKSVLSKYPACSVDLGTSKGTGFLRQLHNFINCLLSNKVILVLRKISKQQHQETTTLPVINAFHIITTFPYHIEWAAYKSFYECRSLWTCVWKGWLSFNHLLSNITVFSFATVSVSSYMYWDWHMN